MSRRNEHVIVVMLEHQSIGQEFIEWPLHVTVVPWFPCDDAKKLDQILTDIAKNQQKFSIEVGDIDKFGPKKNVVVNLVRDSGELNRLHWDVFNILENNNFGIHQKEYVGEGYRAHITHQPHGRKNKGDKLDIRSFTLVKQVRQKKTGTMVKTIVKDYELR